MIMSTKQSQNIAGDDIISVIFGEQLSAWRVIKQEVSNEKFIERVTIPGMKHQKHNNDYFSNNLLLE